jgi:hypothetical protein
MQQKTMAVARFFGTLLLICFGTLSLGSLMWVLWVP